MADALRALPIALGVIHRWPAMFRVRLIGQWVLDAVGTWAVVGCVRGGRGTVG